MAEYTPTTEDVRYVYIANCNLSNCNADHEDEFDRWLAEHDRKVRNDALDEAISESGRRLVERDAWNPAAQAGAVTAQDIVAKRIRALKTNA